LMRALDVIMRDEFFDEQAKMALAKRHDVGNRSRVGLIA
jgi:hypothetical protein